METEQTKYDGLRYCNTILLSLYSNDWLAVVIIRTKQYPAIIIWQHVYSIKATQHQVVIIKLLARFY